LTHEDANNLFQLAANNAILYGVGIIKLINTPTGIVVEVIAPHEYLQTSESLKWASEHMILPRTQ
jgi:hypothetical protein